VHLRYATDMQTYGKVSHKLINQLTSKQKSNQLAMFLRNK